ncbi:putative cytochrome c oxidase subunit IV [Trypoxylus dichotomus]
MKEKKELYRASFCRTFAEFQYISSEWMYVVGLVLVSVSAGIWMYIWFQIFVYGPRPPSYSYESREAQLRRMINLRVNPINGLSSNWDYEKSDWKHKGWFTPPNPFAEQIEMEKYLAELERENVQDDSDED